MEKRLLFLKSRVMSPVPWCLVLCLLVFWGCTSQKEWEKIEIAGKRQKHMVAPKKVLLVHSYHKEYEWVAGITRGVRRALGGHNVDLQLFYMDAKRRNGEPWRYQAGAMAKEVVAQWRPDVVIAADDDAQQYFARDFAGASWPLVVFCGVSEPPESYGYPAKNITGILERPHFAASLSLLRRIVPGVRRIAVMTDNSATSRGALEYMKNETAGFDIISWSQPGTLEQWRQQVQVAGKAADALAVYMYHTVGQRGTAQNVEPRQLMSWTVANARVPVVGFFTFAMDDGALCGMVESGAEHGYEAGQISLQVLAGKKPADFPVKTAKYAISMLNLETAKKLGINIPHDIKESVDIVTGE